MRKLDDASTITLKTDTHGALRLEKHLIVLSVSMSIRWCVATPATFVKSATSQKCLRKS